MADTLTRIQVSGTYQDPNRPDFPVEGKIVQFVPNAKRILNAGGATICIPQTLNVVLDSNGSFSVPLIATNDPDGTPTGWTYTVKEPFGTDPYPILVPFDSPGLAVDLVDIAPAASSSGGTVQLVGGIGISGVSLTDDGTALVFDMSDGSSQTSPALPYATTSALAGKANTADVVPLTQRGASNGVATLDSNERLSIAARPNMAEAPSGSDDTTALQSFITASITAGAPMLLPEDATYLVTSLSFDDAKGVKFGGNGGPDVNSKTILRRTTSGTDSLITAHRASGLGLERLKIENNNASYTGTLLNLAGTASPLADTGRVTVSSCTIGGSSSSTATALGVDLDGTYGIEFNNRTVFQWCGTAVRGCIAAGRGYANGVHFNGAHFSASTSPHVKNPGNAWKFTNCIFSNRIGGVGGSCAGHDSDAPAPDGVTFDSCWFGDVTSGTNAQIEVNGNSYVTLGGFLGVGGGTGYKFTVGSTRNFTVIGVRPHGSSGFLVDLNGTSGHARMVILAQSGAGCTDFASGSIPPTGSIWMDSNGLRMRSADVVAPTTGDWMRFYQSDGTTERLAVQAAGELAWMASDGSNDAGTHILRQQTGLLRATGKFTAMAGLSVGNNAAGSALGTVVNTTEIFDATGTSLGFVPIYDQITTDAPVVRTTTDQTSPDQTLITDATLQLNLRANGVYDIDGVLFYVASQTGDLQYGFSVPSGATFAWNSGGEMSTATSATGSYQFNQGGNASQVTVAGNTPTVEVSRFRGVITVGSSGGLLKLQWRQAAADATATTLKAQSFMRATKIA